MCLALVQLGVTSNLGTSSNKHLVQSDASAPGCGRLRLFESSPVFPKLFQVLSTLTQHFPWPPVNTPSTTQLNLAQEILEKS